MEIAIESRRLSKIVLGQKILDEVELSIPSGTCFGLLGPSGSGKSSFLKMIYAGSEPTSGELYVNGLIVTQEHSKRIKSKLGIVLQDGGLDSDFSVFDNLVLHGMYFNLPKKKSVAKARDLLHQFSLHEKDQSSIESLPLNLRRRLSIAKVLMSDPEILILDEPTKDLDPRGRTQLWEIIRNLKRRGLTILIGTQLMDEAEALCEQVAMLDKGKVLAAGAPSDLIEKFIGTEIVEFKVKPGDMEYHLLKIRKEFEFQVIQNRVRVFIPKDREGRDAVAHIASEDIHIRRANLKDVFMKMAGYESKEL